MLRRSPLVGYGWWASTSPPAKGFTPGFRLVCVVEPALAQHETIRRRGFSRIASYEEALLAMENVDA